MSRIIISVLGILTHLFFSESITAQSFPDYSERALLINDTLAAKMTPHFDITPSDGTIDPLQYYVGPGDNLLILIRGVVDQSYNITINQEGVLVIPKTGIIDLKDVTLSDAREQIKKLILQVYRNVDIHISLTNLKKIKINLIGSVTKPVSVILPGNSRVFDILSASSGLNQNADLRNIKIINTKNEVKSIDLVSFLRLGDRTNNPYMREGDIIKIDPSDNVVSVLGNVKYPGTYEYVENETAQHLLDIAGGFLDNARQDTIEITGFNNNDLLITSSYYSYNEIKENLIYLIKGDKVIVRQKPEYRVDRYVNVSGFIKYPGFYKITKDKTKLYELLVNEAGGFLERASLKDAYIIRKSGLDEIDPEFERLKSIPRSDMNDDEYDYLKAKSRQKKGKMIVDFERLFMGKDYSEDLILKEGDEIYIPEKENFITLVGQVLKPGNIVFKPGLKVDDYINLAGGFGWRAIQGDIRVIKSNTGEWLDADDADELTPGDIIWVPEDPPAPRFWDIFQTSLSVVGQVATVIAATVAVIIAVR